jgi:hypothetical protein
MYTILYKIATIFSGLRPSVVLFLSIRRYTEYHNTVFLYQYNQFICVILSSVSVNV